MPKVVAIGVVDMDGVAVEFRVDGDRSQPEVMGGADDPHGDLAAIGDENGFHGAHPKRESPTLIRPPC